MRFLRNGFPLACALLLVLCALGPSDAAADAAQDRATLALVRVSHLAATGRCSEALAIAEAAAPRDAQTELVIGKCAIRARDYARAISALDRAGELDSLLLAVNLYRGIALYHLEDYSAARTALAGARAVGEEAGVVEFYNGLLLLREDRVRQAALAFERAAARGPDLVEPMASYYAALAWQSLDEGDPLNRAVARVAQEDPDGPWAREAERLLALQAQRHRGGQTGLQRWASLKAGAEFDSNVVLRGNDVTLPRGVSGDDDWRAVWSVMLGAELLEVERFTFGAMFGYAGNAHDDLSTFNQHFASATTWVDHELGATTLGRLRLDFGYGWIDEDPYRINLDMTALAEERWGRWGTTRCSFGAQWNDYRYQVDLAQSNNAFNDDVDQDGFGLSVGCDQELPITAIGRFDPSLYGGYHFASYFAQGIEWDHVAHTLELGARAKLPLAVELDVSGSYTRRNFRGATHFAVAEAGEESQVGPDRNDDSFQVEVELARELGDSIEISARYQYMDNGSSAAAFDYKRHVGGAYVEVKFP